MRQIVLDTETTGLEPSQGHRVIEIGCVELINRRLTGNNLHIYINPQREIDAGANRGEEQSQQQTLEGFDIHFQLVTVFAFRQHYTGHKCAQRW